MAVQILRALSAATTIVALDTAADKLETAKRLGTFEGLLSDEEAVARIKDMKRGRALSRPPNDDIVDILYTLLVGGVGGPPISDGVDHATQPANRGFPHLVASNPDPPDVISVLAVASAPPEGATPSPA